jgi:hypothetical protein
MRWLERTVAVAMSLSIGGVALLALVVLSQRWQQPGYAMPGIVLVVAGLCVGLTLAGGVLAACRQRPLLPGAHRTHDAALPGRFPHHVLDRASRAAGGDRDPRGAGAHGQASGV